MESFVITDHQESRYDRHHLIDWWDQQRLKAAKILVAGAGALGNEVLKNLALVGVGNITVIDFDTVSITNLTRSVLFRESDVGLPKVEIARQRVLEPHGESWLKPEMLVNLPTTNYDIIPESDILNTLEIEANVKIEWQDMRISQGTNNIEWIDMR
ncbi:HesA/MoeB/ThiF family protein [Cuspidothrix issatschenkoi]|uniref:HesA/MoeB/ThiF family protein n=1 Tax=Cuspidothrix issatschenkoi TaxID=230752 RepID=UPI001A9C89D5|nr:ThiF family adenylyltransferase [Cuspidothrix issatschenkoi]